MIGPQDALGDPVLRTPITGIAFGCARGGFGGCHDHINSESHQFGSETGKSLDPPVGGPEVDDNILTLDIAQLAQALIKSLGEGRPSRSNMQIADPRDPAYRLHRGGERRGDGSSQRGQ